MVGFGEYACSIKCGDNENAKRIDSYDELINKIRESRSDRTQIIFCGGDGKEVSFYLDCVSGCKDERNIYQKGSQIDFLGFSVATPNSEGGKDVKYYELDKYNYPVVDTNLISVKKSVEQFFNKINTLVGGREYKILPEQRQGVAESKFIYRTNGDLGLPITSLIFLLCDAARIEPCFEIGKKINSYSNESFTINSLSNYVNKYGNCYEFTYGISPAKVNIFNKDRIVLSNDDYSSFNYYCNCRDLYYGVGKSDVVSSCYINLKKSIDEKIDICQKEFYNIYSEFGEKFQSNVNKFDNFNKLSNIIKLSIVAKNNDKDIKFFLDKEKIKNLPSFLKEIVESKTFTQEEEKDISNFLEKYTNISDINKDQYSISI
ncbi:MAG: hypothetical protein J6C50_00550 [Rickettsiales bacterium]|nr:hypothetical protein [Rickettsiales bacterium]